MAFQLPLWADLSAQQKNIIGLPLDEDYVIPGSPGTGKTVLALYRAAQLSEQGKHKVLMLVFNKPLSHYLDTVVSKDRPKFKGVEVRTYDGWLYNWYNNKPPLTNSNDHFSYDWQQINQDMQRHKDEYDHVLLDESQDFPEELLKILQIVSVNVTCFVDSNQAIIRKKTTIEKFLNLFFKNQPYQLTTNYRNSKYIAELSRIYWNKEGCFARPDGNGKTSKPIEIFRVPIEQQLNKVATIIENNLGLSIGVIVGYDTADNVYNMLKPQFEPLGVKVQRYSQDSKKYNLLFGDGPCVHILTYNTMKGLEYDMVIIPYFDNIKSSGDLVKDTNIAYVAITRARENLVILYENEQDRNGKAQIVSKFFAFVNAHLDMFKWSK